MQPSFSPRYTNTAIALHWLIALALIGMLTFGWYMVGLPFSPSKVKYYNWHKWAGITILLLSVMRFAWRLTHRPPPLPSSMLLTMPRWQQLTHHGVHHLLYALFFAAPLIGWAYSCAAGFPVVLFGLWQLPNLVTPDTALAEALKPLHMISAYALAVLIALHIAAALKHQLINRDHLLSRMLISR